jgi:putative transposase
MTKSAKGTVENPGKNVKQKSGLNREILDTAPRKLLNMIHYKVEETDGHYEEVETRKIKPSQRCPDCLAVAVVYFILMFYTVAFIFFFSCSLM